SQMVRLGSGETLICLLHALHCLFEAGAATYMTAGIGTHLRNPLPHALMRWPMSGVPRRRAKPFDSNQLFDPLRIDTTVLTGNAATQGVPNDCNGKHLQLFEELRHIQD